MAEFNFIAKTQPNMARMLKDEAEKNLISQSMLFYGAEYTSKMSAAIELALTLTNNIEEFYTLNESNIIILSSRDSSLRIKAALNIYKAKRTTAAKNFLFQQIRIVLLSFHPVLSSSEEIFEKASEVNELLYQFDDIDEENDKKFLKLLDTLESKLNPILDKIKKQNSVSIDQIRLIQDWLNETSNEKKVIIIEGIEGVSEGAKNSLLKLLEEPKENAYIILITSSIHRILPTLLSRLRKYHFPQISKEYSNKFLSSTFFESEKFQSIKEYLLRKADIDTKTLRENAEFFITNSINKIKIDPVKFMEIASFIESYDMYPMFVEYMLEIISDLYKKNNLNGKRANHYIKVITSMYNSAIIFNQNKRVMLERINLELALEK